MKRMLLIASFLFIGPTLAQGAGNEVVELFIKYSGDVINVDYRSGKVTKALKIKLIEEGGLTFINARMVAKEVGDEARAKAHPFSYAFPKETKVTVEVPDSHFVFSSFSKNGESRRLSQWIVGIANKQRWQKSSFQSKGVNFELVNPTLKPQIEVDHWKNNIEKVWSKFVERFGVPTNHLVIVDMEGPISGGPLGENVLGMFATDKISPEVQKEMEANLGWKPARSTKEYVQQNYPRSKDAWSEYLIGTYSHEIGHLFFGFGHTREEVSHSSELWFSLGLGMVYDMEVTSEIVGREPQLEVDIIRSWRDRYAKQSGLDQRLINPDKSADQKFDFDRTKVFAHGNAASFLKKLRIEVGKVQFDAAVKKYLSECGECRRGYEDFLNFLPTHKATIAKVEQEYGVR